MKKKNKRLNSIKKKLKMTIDKLHHVLFETKFGNCLFITLGIFIIVLYLTLYFFKEPIVDEEVRPWSMNNLIPWEVKGDESFLKAMIVRPFNLSITELGKYRPRYLAFLVQFLDENIFLRLVRRVPVFGNRVPFFPVAMFLTILSIYYFIRTVWKKLPKGFAFFLSSVVIMYQNYQVTTYWRARSAKLLAVSACIFLLTYALKRLDIKFEKKHLKTLLLSIPIFLLMTLDEQVLALAFFIAFLSLVISIIDKKINLPFVLYSVASFIYLTFHLFWGKWLFARFSGGLQEHGHTISGAVSGIGLTSLKQSFEILMSVVPKLIFMSFIVFAVVYIYSFVKIKKKDKKQVIINLFLLLTPFILLMIMIDAHKPIYTILVLWKSVYPMIAVILLFLSLIYVLAVSNYKYDKIKPFILLIGVVISLVYNINHVSYYYGAYFKTNGGFMENATDMEITSDSIIIEEVPVEEMQYKNDSVISSLHTPFTTSDFKTAIIASGDKIKKGNNYYITDNFSCYLNTQENRKLIIDAVVKDYKKYNSVTVLINKYELKTLPIEDEHINLELDVRSERYRAAKISLQFHRKDGTNEADIDEKKIQIKKLYMK